MSRAPIPPDLADEFVVRHSGRATAVVRRSLAGPLEALGLLDAPEPAADPTGLGATVGGRGGAWIAAPEGGPQVVVRPGRRGGWFGRLVRSRYFTGDRFVQELVLTERLRRRGAPVPAPLAAVRRERRLGYETWLVTRRLEGAVPAAEALARAVPGRLTTLLGAMGGAIRALHDAGGEHADLNAWNVLVGEAAARPAGWIVDLDRGRLFEPPLAPERAARNLARLRRSLRKLELEAALSEWPSLERGYASREA